MMKHLYNIPSSIYNNFGMNLLEMATVVKHIKLGKFEDCYIVVHGQKESCNFDNGRKEHSEPHFHILSDKNGLNVKVDLMNFISNGELFLLQYNIGDHTLAKFEYKESISLHTSDWTQFGLGRVQKSLADTLKIKLPLKFGVNEDGTPISVAQRLVQLWVGESEEGLLEKFSKRYNLPIQSQYNAFLSQC